MNEANYASLEASKRLVEAGIVLETEALWVKWYFDSSTNMNYHPYEWRLMYRGLTQDDLKSIPAPCMAEVWRELPPFEGHGKIYEAKENINPTDALVALLIWVRSDNESGESHEGGKR